MSSPVQQSQAAANNSALTQIAMGGKGSSAMISPSSENLNSSLSAGSGDANQPKFMPGPETFSVASQGVLNDALRASMDGLVANGGMDSFIKIGGEPNFFDAFNGPVLSHAKLAQGPMVEQLNGVGEMSLSKVTGLEANLHAASGLPGIMGPNKGGQSAGM